MIVALANTYPFAPGEAVGPHASGSVMTLVCLRGTGLLELAGGACRLATGDALRLEPGAPRRYRADAREPFALIGVHATPGPGLPVHDVADPRAVGGPAEVPCRHDGAGHLRAVAERLTTVFGEPPSPGRDGLLTALLAVLDAEWVRLADAPAVGGRLGGIASWLRLPHDRAISRAEMAQRAGMAESTFAAAFRAAYGVPPLRYLNEVRLERARELLATTALPVAQIAGSCGFGDLPWFSRYFRARTGMSPGAWRRSRRRI